MNITIHARKRSKSRKNLNKKQASKDFKRAKKEGLRINEIPSEYIELKKYMNSKYYNHRILRPTVILYNGYIYIIVKQVVITMYDLKDELYQMAIELENKIQNERKSDSIDQELPVVTLEEFLGH